MLDKQTYAAYLYKNLLMHKAVEEKVFPVLEESIKDISERKKTGAIQSDLNELGTQQAYEISFFDEQYRNNIAFNLGLAYVTEGSTLGGLYILKNVKQALGPGAPVRFLSVYGDKTGSRWKSFLESLHDFQSNLTKAEEENILKGAVYGFERAKAIFAN